ncbi:MAG TPA: hypothetical protein VF037_04740, partial [Gemmatimonadales bacterium]
MTRSKPAGVTLVAAALAAAAIPAAAQSPIQDNSFLLEEAYNQERGVVQHISTFEHDGDGAWEYAFTQEWPLGGLRHQLGYTLPLLDRGLGTGVGDFAVNYRMQAVGHPHATLLVAPRITLLVPTGDPAEGRGSGGPGVQLNLPVTAVLGPRLVSHWNAGATFVPSADAPDGGTAATRSVNLGAGAVWLLRPALNFLLEAVWSSDAEAVSGGVTARSEAAFVSPGVRGAVNLGGIQVVPGIAYLVGVGPSEGATSVFLYLSLEHAFSRQAPSSFRPIRHILEKRPSGR